MNTKLLFCLSIIISIFGVLYVTCNPFGRKQAVAAEGYLMCNGKPATDAKIKLYDADTFTKDDKMAETRTDSRGYFKLSGYSSEITRIDPKLNIYHKCTKSINPMKKICYQKFSIKIPKSYITTGTQAAKTYNAGQLELSGKFPGQTTDCLN
uniref:Transthyretin-like family protein n=1 Tax=Parastrongyloides trichosuri TaxID=131310 RepID=A0A0N5A2R2_PARTI